MAQLKRSLGLAECVFYGVGSILGAGIYTLIGKVAGIGGNTTWIAFLIASACAFFTALSYAELSTMFPKAGGEFVYANKAFGKKTGLFLGIIITLNGIITGSAVAVGFAGYFNDLTGSSFGWIPIAVVAVIFLVNAIGIKQSSWVNIIFTIIEAAGLILVIWCGFSSLGKVNVLEAPSEGINGIFTASALAFFAFVGFEEIVKLSEETKNPEKNIPRALIITSLIVAAMYVLVSLAAVSAVPFEELGRSKSPLADVVQTGIGKAGIITISVIALFSTSNTILSNMLGASRILYNMSKETRLLKPFSVISEKRKTPIPALLLILVVMSAFSLIGDIEVVARIASVFIFITFIGVNCCLIALRIKDKRTKRHYRAPMNIRNIPVTAVIGILATLALFVFNIISLVTGGAEN